MSRFALPAAVTAVFLVGVAATVALFGAGGQGPGKGGAPHGTRVEIASLVLRPASAFFGETVTADASVLVHDLDPARVAVRPDFRPYSVVGSSGETGAAPGHRTMIRLHWTLQCLRTRCLARDGARAVYAFPVSVAGPGGAEQGFFPSLLVVSRLGDGNARMRDEVLLGRQDTSSVPNPAVISLGALGLLGAAAMLVFVPSRRTTRARAGAGDPIEDDGLRAAIERAEARRVTVSRAEQRGALDHLARAVAAREPELAFELRAVAWRETDPDDAAIELLLQRARSLIP